jgi:hypothetical protein
MVVSLYSVYDRASKKYGPLFEAKNHDAAIRKFRRRLLTKAGKEQDYELHYCGEFDRERGRIGTKDQPDLVAFTKIDAPESIAMTASEAIEKLREKLNGRVYVAAIEKLERQARAIEEKYGPASGEVIASHFRPILEVLDAIGG